MEKKKKKKKNLSNEKLKIEILNLRKPWYKKLEFWKILIPTIAVITSLYFTFGKGIVDSQKEKLSIQKEQLKLEILQFEIKKGSVIEDINEIKKELNIKESKLDSLNQSIEDLNTENNSYLNQIIKSKNEIQNIKTQKESELKSISKERKLDKDFLSKKLFEQYSIAKKRAQNIHDYKSKISYLRGELKKVKAENDFLKTKVNLTSFDSIELYTVKSYASIESLKESNDNINAEIKRINENYKKAKEKIDNDSLSFDDAIREIELWLMRKDYDKKEQKKKE